MSKIKVGDLVKLRILRHTSIKGRQFRFRLATKDERYVESRELDGKKGIVVSEGTGWHIEVYQVAFGSIVIQAYQDYFEKVEKRSE